LHVLSEEPAKFLDVGHAAEISFVRGKGRELRDFVKPVANRLLWIGKPSCPQPDAKAECHRKENDLKDFFHRETDTDMPGLRGASQQYLPDDAFTRRGALFVIFKRHGTIVTHHIILPRAELLGRRLPISAGICKIWLIKWLAINVNCAARKRNGFTGHADDSFHVHDVIAGKANADDVATLRFMAQVREPVDEIDLPVAVRGEHAWPGDAHRIKHKTENEKSHERKAHQQTQPQQGPLGSSADDDGLKPSWNSPGLGFAVHSRPVKQPKLLIASRKRREKQATMSGARQFVAPCAGTVDFLFTPGI